MNRIAPSEWGRRPRLQRVSRLALLLTPLLLAQTPQWQGNWQGTLEAGPAKLRIGLHITLTPAGAFTATLDSIDQAETGIPVATTRISGRELHLDLPALRPSFDGDLTTDDSGMEGIFTQGVLLPLTFKRVAQVETVRRPQQPKPPLPYDAEEVTYSSGPVRLAGTLTHPRGPGPFPEVLLLTSSASKIATIPSRDTNRSWFWPTI